MTQTAPPITNPSTSSPPLDPPDTNSNRMEEEPRPSYKEAVTDKSKTNSTYYDQEIPNEIRDKIPTNPEASIIISSKEKNIIYSAWIFSVIIKCVSKKTKLSICQSKTRGDIKDRGKTSAHRSGGAGTSSQ